MAGNTANLRIRINGDSRGAEKSLDDVTKSVIAFRAEVVKNTAAIAALAYTVNDLVRQIIGAQKRLDAFEASMLAISGSTVAAAESMVWLKDEANRLGQSIQTMSHFFPTFAASSTALGMSVRQTRDMFSGMMEVMTVFNKSADDTAGVLNAMQQMMDKTRISTEELQSQMAERGLPYVFSTMAQAAYEAGVIAENSIASLRKAMENGEVETRDVLHRFVELYRNVVADGLEDATSNMRANMERFNNEWEYFLRNIAESGAGDLLTGIFKEAAQSLKSINDNFQLGIDTVDVYFATTTRGLQQQESYLDKAVSGWKLIGKEIGDLFGDALPTINDAIQDFTVNVSHFAALIINGISQIGLEIKYVFDNLPTHFQYVFDLALEKFRLFDAKVTAWSKFIGKNIINFLAIGVDLGISSLRAGTSALLATILPGDVGAAFRATAEDITTGMKKRISLQIEGASERDDSIQAARLASQEKLNQLNQDYSDDVAAQAAAFEDQLRLKNDIFNEILKGWEAEKEKNKTIRDGLKDQLEANRLLKQEAIDRARVLSELDSDKKERAAALAKQKDEERKRNDAYMELEMERAISMFHGLERMDKERLAAAEKAKKEQEKMNALVAKELDFMDENAKRRQQYKDDLEDIREEWERIGQSIGRAFASGGLEGGLGAIGDVLSGKLESTVSGLDLFKGNPMLGGVAGGLAGGLLSKGFDSIISGFGKKVDPVVEELKGLREDIRQGKTVLGGERQMSDAAGAAALEVFRSLAVQKWETMEASRPSDSDIHRFITAYPEFGIQNLGVGGAYVTKDLETTRLDRFENAVFAIGAATGDSEYAVYALADAIKEFGYDDIPSITQELIDAYLDIEEGFGDFAVWSGLKTEVELAQNKIDDFNDQFGDLGVSLDSSKESAMEVYQALEDNMTPAARLAVNALYELSDAIDTLTEDKFSLLDTGLTDMLDTMLAAFGYQVQQQQDLEQAATTTTRVVTDLNDVVNELQRSELKPLPVADRIAAAQSQYQSLLAAARGGDVEAAKELGGVAKDYLNISKQYAGSASQYRKTFAEVVNGLTEIGEVTETVTTGGSSVASATDTLIQASTIAPTTDSILGQINLLAESAPEEAKEYLAKLISLADVDTPAELSAFVQTVVDNTTNLGTASELAAYTITQLVRSNDITNESQIAGVVDQLLRSESIVEGEVGALLDELVRTGAIEQGDIGKINTYLESLTRLSDSNIATIALTLAGIANLDTASPEAIATALGDLSGMSFSSAVDLAGAIGSTADLALGGAWNIALAIQRTAGLDDGDALNLALAIVRASALDGADKAQAVADAMGAAAGLNPDAIQTIAGKLYGISGIDTASVSSFKDIFTELDALNAGSASDIADAIVTAAGLDAGEIGLLVSAIADAENLTVGGTASLVSELIAVQDLSSTGTAELVSELAKTQNWSATDTTNLIGELGKTQNWSATDVGYLIRELGKTQNWSATDTANLIRELGKTQNWSATDVGYLIAHLAATQRWNPAKAGDVIEELARTQNWSATSTADLIEELGKSQTWTSSMVASVANYISQIAGYGASDLTGLATLIANLAAAADLKPNQIQQVVEQVASGVGVDSGTLSNAVATAQSNIKQLAFNSYVKDVIAPRYRDTYSADQVNAAFEYAKQGGLKFHLDVPNEAFVFFTDSINSVFESIAKNSMMSYDTGTSRVPNDMIANIHKGEMIIDPRSSEVLRKYGININQQSNDALLKEMQQLRAEVQGLRAEARSTAVATNKTKRVLERVTRDGEALLTEVVT